MNIYLSFYLLYLCVFVTLWLMNYSGQKQLFKKYKILGIKINQINEH